MLKPQPSSQFKRDYKRVKKQGKDIEHLQKIVTWLSTEKDLPLKYKDHLLSGDWHGYRECHLSPDWLLIYKVDARAKILKLMRTGSHAHLFKK